MASVAPAALKLVGSTPPVLNFPSAETKSFYKVRAVIAASDRGVVIARESSMIV